MNYKGICLGLGLLLGSSMLQAGQPVHCTIRDDSGAIKNRSNNANALHSVNTVTSQKQIVGDNQKKVQLIDKRYAVQVARYVGQIQIIIMDNETHRDVVMATTPESAFISLDLSSEMPNVTISCMPEPSRDPAEKVEVKEK